MTIKHPTPQKQNIDTDSQHQKTKNGPLLHAVEKKQEKLQN